MTNNDNGLKEYHFKAYCNLTKTLIILHSAGIAAVISFIGITMTCSDPQNKLLLNLKIALILFLIGIFLSLLEAVVEYLSYFIYNKFEVEKLEGTTAAIIFFWTQFVLIVSSIILLIIGGYIGFVDSFIINK